MNWVDYREKLGIGFSDKEKASYFITKMFNVLDDNSDEIRNQIDEKEFFVFCDMTGTPMRHTRLFGERYNLIIKVIESHSSSLEDFLAYYIAFINCQKDNSYKPLKRKDYINLACNLLDDSLLPYEIVEDKEGVYIFPKGVPELDSALVSEPLHWLKASPSAEKAWIKALREYAESHEENASDIADKFRKTLEAFFQEFFNGSKSLENYKTEYGDYLKQRGIPKEVAGNFETLLQAYTNYINNYAKHRDATSDKVLEYLMYQTGNIMRLLITV